MRTRLAALLVVPPLVAAVFGTLCALGYLLVLAFGLPPRLGLPTWLRLAGVIVLGAGFGLFGWLRAYRGPVDLLVSTYLTFAKAVQGMSPSEPAGRTESLVIVGPHRCVRHPLYAAIIVLVAGWWLVLDYTFLLFAAGLLALWFNFVVAPFEERELHALFGPEYRAYAGRTPRLLPSLRGGRSGSTSR